MAYLLTGALGFLLGYLTELGAARRLLPLRLSLWAVCLGLIGHSLVMVAVQSPRFRLHESAVLAGWALLPIAALLLVYSLFIELPLARTYARVRSPIRVITTGTYALVRHPTVLWYVLLLSSLLLVSRSLLILAAVPVWIALDMLWAVLQERSLLAEAREEYSAYRRRTPFLVPSLRSIRSCLRSFLTFQGSKVSLGGDPSR